MKHIKSLYEGNLTSREVVAHKGCGECQSSCQSACKTSCTVANQVCKNEK